jgi:lipopolysaccharide transport system permease protein
MRLLGAFDQNDRRLGVSFAVMMLRDRFLGTGLGTFWAILQPMSLIAVYIYVFSFLFKSKLAGHEESTLAFVIWLVSGYGPWLAINDGIMAGSAAIIGHSSLVKNMAFKTELLPISATSLGIVPLLVSVAILSVLIMLDGREPNLAWLIMIPVLMMQCLFVAGLGLILGATTVFVRDLILLLPTLLTIILFLSPIFYPITLFPEGIRDIVVWNPFYIITNAYRAPILDGELPPWPYLVYLAAVAFPTYWLGLRYFRRVKTYFHGRL